MLLSASRGVGVLEMPAGRAKAKGGKGRSKVGAKKPIAKRRKANVGKKKQREAMNNESRFKPRNCFHEC